MNDKAITKTIKRKQELIKIKNYITALLATYMFALMLLPCSDTCNSHQHETPSTIQTAQDHHQEDNDVCSPFCFCSCRSSAMTTFYLPTYNFIPHYTVQDFSVLDQIVLSNELSNIWQPPKIS